MNKAMLKRIRVFIALVVLIFIILSSRLAYLQIIQYDYYWNRAENNRLRILPITAPRGEIYAKNGEQLVTNRPGFTVSLVDLGSGYSDNTITFLSGLLEMDEQEINEKIDLQNYRRYLPVRLKTDVDIEIVSKIAERRLELPGVMIEVQPIRNYVYGSFASHILGYMGEGTVPERIKEYWGGLGYEYQPGELVGQSGIELAWEPFLRGEDGGVQVEVNSTGQAIREFERVEPVPGANLFLTLDLQLQQVLERSLVEVIEGLLSAGNEYAGEAAAVVLDPRNGRILAMASIPSYNLNTFRFDFSQLVNDPLRPLVNKAIEEHYPVGSTFKMVTAMGALEKGLISRTERVYCGGTITRYGATKSCYHGRAHGAMNILEAIKKSCNIFFYELGLRQGIDALAYYSRQFGFGNVVGLKDIFGEKSGIVASREFKSTLYPDEPWYPAETMDASIGQSFHSITPLQLANYAAMIANCGVHYRPYLVEKVVDTEGSTVMIAEPEVLSYMEAKDTSWEIIREGMSLVTQPGGTGALLADLPVRVAGKTGTAQVVGKDGSIPSHSLFVGYAPLEDPELAFAVIIKHGESSGSTSIPVVRKIIEHYFGAPEESLDSLANNSADSSREGNIQND
ncbi:MAG TPA: penicillin-binding protein 2 [Firmicutes bacterium]|jgi:penicillin-binding protein 2|nr:penicillin-binding protein 2 [Bacillota bacterium]